MASEGEEKEEISREIVVESQRTTAQYIVRILLSLQTGADGGSYSGSTNADKQSPRAARSTKVVVVFVLFIIYSQFNIICIFELNAF